MTVNPGPPSIDPIREHYAAIGLVVVDWARFEAYVDYFALTLAGLREKVGACFTAQISGIGRKLDAYIAVAWHLGATTSIKQLTEFAASAAKLSERRNRLVHDVWDIHTERDPHRFEITARKKLRYEFIPVPTKDVFKCAEDIRFHIEGLIKLHALIASEISKSSDESKNDHRV